MTDTIVNDQTQIAVMGEKINTIQRDIQEIKGDIKSQGTAYVSRQEFETFKAGDFANIKRLVYGAVGLLATAFLLGIINFFLRKP